MNLDDSGLGEVYVDSTTWQMLPGVPERNIAAPTATGACDTAVLYKSTPPACIKTVRFQITTNASADGYARPATSPFRIQILLRHCLQCYPRCDWLLKVNTRHMHLAVRPGRRERRRIKEYTKPTGTRAK